MTTGADADLDFDDLLGIEKGEKLVIKKDGEELAPVVVEEPPKEEKKEAAPVERNDCSRNRLPGQLVKRKVEKEESSRSQARNRSRRKRRNSSTGKTQR